MLLLLGLLHYRTGFAYLIPGNGGSYSWMVFPVSKKQGMRSGNTGENSE
jgi:PHP family Zn ribbon phosphoesterase